MGDAMCAELLAVYRELAVASSILANATAPKLTAGERPIDLVDKTDKEVKGGGDPQKFPAGTFNNNRCRDRVIGSLRHGSLHAWVRARVDVCRIDPARHFV
jgi:hypothetical protein